MRLSVNRSDGGPRARRARGRASPWLLAPAALAVLTAVALWMTRGERLVLLALRPERVMGTCSTLLGALPAAREAEGRRALQRAEEVLRRVEALMSVHLERSELSLLNRAPAGAFVPLSAETLAVLHAARDACEASRGAFDATCRPLLELWRRAGRENRLPGPEERASARAASNWRALELLPGGARKALDTVQVDLGGIAKGHAIDRALEALIEARLAGGLVEVGGDLRCFGIRPGRGRWQAALQDPAGPGTLGTLDLTDAALCTSGDYARFVEIEGRRYAHIVDPGSGAPAAAAHSASVLASSARLADAWATALSVLGPAGLELLPAGVEALLLTGAPGEWTEHATPGFPARMGAH